MVFEKFFEHILLALGKSYNSQKYHSSEKYKSKIKTWFTFGLKDEQMKNYKFSNSFGIIKFRQ